MIDVLAVTPKPMTPALPLAALPNGAILGRIAGRGELESE